MKNLILFIGASLIFTTVLLFNLNIVSTEGSSGAVASLSLFEIEQNSVSANCENPGEPCHTADDCFDDDGYLVCAAGSEGCCYVCSVFFVSGIFEIVVCDWTGSGSDYCNSSEPCLEFF